MALVKGTNSYVTVAEAEVYFETRIDTDAWVSASASMKAQALVTASSLLNDLSWVGVAISESQTLAFPRAGYFLDPLIGYEVAIPSTVPKRVENACFELAYHLINTDGLLDDTGFVKDLTIGGIALNITRAPSVIPGTVKRVIRPLLLKAGNSWWRAN